MTGLIRRLGPDEVGRNRPEQLCEYLPVLLRGTLPQGDCFVSEWVSNHPVFLEVTFVQDGEGGRPHEVRHISSFAITLLRVHETKML